MNGDYTDRLSQENEPRDAKLDKLLEEAEIIAQRVLESIQAIAGTTACKGVQIARLKDWAKEKGCWFDSVKALGEYVDRGSENEVYIAIDDSHKVYKLNDFRYADDNLTPFFERIKAHNSYFPYCAYTLIGFAPNADGKVCALLEQPYIISEREATVEEIDSTLRSFGFHPEFDGEYYSNGTHDIFDMSPNNVLVGIDGNLYFIDTILYKTNQGNLHSYKSLSPKS